MKTMKQIIQDTYNTKPEFKEQIERYELSLEDVGVTIYNSNPWNTNAKIVNSYNTGAPITLSYSIEDGRAVTQSLSLIHPMIEKHTRAIA